jgi:hypothetical protein
VGTTTGFLILIGGFVIFLIVYFQGSKKKDLPTKLNMKATVPPAPPQSPQSSQTQAAPVSLNVIFNYNGHSFDAYETLGVPAGSSWDEVKVAFENTIAVNETASHEFYLTAFNAIKARQKF